MSLGNFEAPKLCKSRAGSRNGQPHTSGRFVFILQKSWGIHENININNNNNKKGVFVFRKGRKATPNIMLYLKAISFPFQPLYGILWKSKKLAKLSGLSFLSTDTHAHTYTLANGGKDLFLDFSHELKLGGSR